MEPDDTLVMILSPNIASAKYSGLENFKATDASNGEKMIKQIALNTPPNVEPKVDKPKALPGCFNFVAMGYPSSVVATDAGVPGVFKRIAEIDPPYIAPQYIPSNIRIPPTPWNANVRGNNRAIPILTESPGMAPIRIPAPVPKTKPSRFVTVNTLPSAVIISAILSTSYLINIGSGREIFSNTPNSTYTAASVITVVNTIFLTLLTSSKYITAGINSNAPI